MGFSRPAAGVLLAALMIAPALVFAAPVEPLLPGGNLTAPADTGLASEVDLIGGGQGGGGTTDGSSSRDADWQPMLQTRHFGPRAELSCAVAKTPNALVVVNHSPEPLPPGTRIKWTLASEGKRGYFALIGPLGGGDTLVADGVLDEQVDAAAACVARTI